MKSADALARSHCNARHEAIIAAATRLVLQNGLEGTTIDAIACEAKVSRATVYRQKGGREAILSEVLQRQVEPFVAKVRSKTEGLHDLASRMRTGLMEAITQLPHYPVIHRVFGHEISDYNMRILRPVFADMVDATMAAASADAHRFDMIDHDEMSEWQLRNVLYLASCAPWDRNRLERYIDTFILPIFIRAPATVEQMQVSETLGRVERLRDQMAAINQEIEALRATVLGFPGRVDNAGDSDPSQVG